MSVSMQYHGGSCCGVTHLYLGSVSGPTILLPFVKKWSHGSAPDGSAHLMTLITNDNPTPGLTFRSVSGWRAPACSLDRDAEPAGDRVKALVEAYKKTGRRSGMIEAVTTQVQEAWAPFLEELGFVRVGKAKNSNSNNIISMWLLCYGEV